MLRADTQWPLHSAASCCWRSEERALFTLQPGAVLTKRPASERSGGPPARVPNGVRGGPRGRLEARRRAAGLPLEAAPRSQPASGLAAPEPAGPLAEVGGRRAQTPGGGLAGWELAGEWPAGGARPKSVWRRPIRGRTRPLVKRARPIRRPRYHFRAMPARFAPDKTFCARATHSRPTPLECQWADSSLSAHLLRLAGRIGRLSGWPTGPD